MFKINEAMLLDLASNPTILQRGKLYYKNGKVKNIRYDSVNNQFFGLVVGGLEYKVSIVFDDEYHYIDSSCNCPAHSSYSGCCKHIIAMLYSIWAMKKPSKKVVKERQYDTAHHLIHHYSLGNNKVIPLELEVSLKISGQITTISLKIGEKKLYNVKNIMALVAALITRTKLPFGVNFEFDPSIHYFNEASKDLINFLIELYEYEKVINTGLYSYNGSSLFMGKDIILTTTATKRILNLLKGSRINLIIDGEEYTDIPIVEVEEALPINIILDKDKDDILLRISEDNKVIPITEDGEFIFTNDRIIQGKDEELKAIMPIIKKTLGMGNKTIAIPEGLQQRFFSTVYPRLVETKKVQLSEEIHSHIETSKLVARIYLDSDDVSITAKVLFNYGQRIINPFDGSLKEANSRIIIRELDKEEEILSFFEDMEFKVKNSVIYLDNDDILYDFIFNKLEDLKVIAEVYYSDAFKKIKVQENIALAGGVRLSEDNLLEFTFGLENISNEEILAILSSLQESKKFYRLKDGAILRLDDHQIYQLNDIVKALPIKDKDILQGSIRLPKHHSVFVDELIKGNKAIKREESFNSYVERLQNPLMEKYEIPKEVFNIMRDYQKKGFNWIKTFALLGLGGVLADDMGLGKTLQMISAILSDVEAGVKIPSLVICPSSLLTNWYEEVKKFAPSLKVLVICGNPKDRQRLIDKIQRYDLIITSYPLLKKDLDAYISKEFNYYILDEAQYIKNPMSNNAKAVKQLQANYRFALTGTPIENSLSELWSIFDFILPGYLGSYKSFRSRFELPIVKNQDPAAYDALARLVRVFILRRMKEEVLEELPPKIVQVLYADLTRDQKKIYLATLARIRGEIETEIKDKGFQRSHIKILAGLTRLRQICCHPKLFLDNYYSDSGKFSLLLDVINDSIVGGHRILLFSQFTGMLKLIGDFLNGENIEYQYLDGSTDVKDRGAIIREFNQGKGRVFLISLKAGGTGLNLTSADVVIHFDPWWNPAVEEQATDRAYRIGQDKVVHVLKLITKGTIEEKIIALQEKKKQLIDAVIQPGETLLSKLTEEDIKDILQITV